MKILIATAWWPTKTYLFDEFSEGLCDLLYFGKSENIEIELMFATNLHESKYGSNYLSINQCFDYALGNDFTHILILDADIVLSADDLDKMIKSSKDVVLAGRGSGKGLIKHNFETSNIGWGCSLLKTETIKKRPKYTGDFLSPDRSFLKFVSKNNFEVWCHYDVSPKILEESQTKIVAAFAQQKGE
jgi:hypothetical protein